MCYDISITSHRYYNLQEEPLLRTTRNTVNIVQTNVDQQMKFHSIRMSVRDSIDVCSKVMGDWGWWQLRTVLIIYLTKIPAAWFMACIIFTAPEPWYGEYWCNTDNIKNISDTISVINISHPLNIIANGTFQLDYCNVIIKSETINYQSNESDYNVSYMPCNSFNYSLNTCTTLVTQFDLVCSRTLLIAITQCFHLFGVLIGGVAATYMMNYWSPRNVMMIGMVMLLPIGIGTGYMPWFWMHVALRCLAAACCAITFTPGAVIMMDITGGKYRSIVMANFEQYWSIGVVLLSIIGYYVKTWGQIYVTITLPMIIVMILWIWIPDSPRWHLSKQNIDKVYIILKNSLFINRLKSKSLDDLKELLKQQAIDENIRNKNLESQNNWKHLISIPDAMTKVILVFTSFSLMLTCYYGTLLNIRSFGREYLHVNTAIAGVCELIGAFIGLLILMYSNKKWKIVGMFTTFSGIVTCFIWLLPQHVDGSHMYIDLLVISMINKMGISACICVVTTCTGELFPLPHKKRVIFVSTVIARTVFMTAPLIGVTVKYGDGVPLAFFGILTAIGGLCTFCIKPNKNINSNLSAVVTTPKVWNTEGDPNNESTKL